MPTELDTAYMAGIIDGEGSMGVYYVADHHYDNRRGRRSYFNSLSVSNTDKRLIDHLKSIWGGSITTYANHGFKYSWIHRISWQSRSDLLNILNATLPYLVLKKEQAELMIQWCELRKRRKTHKAGYTDEEIKIAQQISNLASAKKRRRQDRAVGSRKNQ